MDAKHLMGIGSTLKKTNTESYNNMLSKFQPYIPINKTHLKNYKDKQNSIGKDEMFLRRSQKYLDLKKNPLLSSNNNISNVNVSHIKKK